MGSYWMVLGLALLPALGNFGGGLLAEFFQANKYMVSKALHAAAGIVIAVVSVELMPAALEKISPVWVAIAFGIGGMTYVLISIAVDKLQGSADNKGAIAPVACGWCISQYRSTWQATVC